jgi:hypothetical protein
MSALSFIRTFTGLLCLIPITLLAQRCGVPQVRSAFVAFDEQVFWLEGKHNVWKPTIEQVETAECILKEKLVSDAHLWSQKLDSSYTIEDYSSANGLVEIYWHYRQYSGATNDRGDRLVCINSFCDPKRHWRRNFVWVLDGGDCYWQAVINLTTNEVEVFEVNGDA